MNKKKNYKKEYMASIASSISTNCKSSSSNNLNNCSSKTNNVQQSYCSSSFVLPNINFIRLQSPKITGIQKRCTSQPKLFSMLDINDKITNKKSTDLPIQYKRRTPEEIKQLLGISSKTLQENRLRHSLHYKKDSDDHDKTKHKGLSNSMIDKKGDYIECLGNQLDSILDNRVNVDEIPQNNVDNNNALCENENNLPKEQNDKDNPHVINTYLGKTNKTSITVSRNKRLYKPYIFDKHSEHCNYIKLQIDKYKPKYLEFCEDLKKQASINKYSPVSKPNIKNTFRDKPINKNVKEDNENELDKTLPLFFHRKIKQKSFDSDIFFLKQQEHSTIPAPEKPNRNGEHLQGANTQKYRKSDIFFKDNDEFSTNKSGEKSFYKKRPNFKYTSSRESNSMWTTKNIMPPLLNHSSSVHHILNPFIKNISPTKEQINEKYKEINMVENIAHKKKGLSEFIDLSRISAPNLNKDYLEMYSKDKSTFARRNEVCSDYNDLYGHCYAKLCDKPFKKFEII